MASLKASYLKLKPAVLWRIKFQLEFTQYCYFTRSQLPSSCNCYSLANKQIADEEKRQAYLSLNLQVG